MPDHRHARPTVLPRLLASMLLLWIASACSSDEPPGGPVRLAVLGDSITAGFGLKPGQAFPTLVEAALSEGGWEITVLNAGHSGDTTRNGLARLDDVIEQHPDAVLVALGGNDGLRARPLADFERDLSAMVQGLQRAGIRVGLVGLRHPLISQRDGNNNFIEVFPRVADRFGIPLLDNLLDGVIGHPGRQLDAIHPNAEGQRHIAERVVAFLLQSDLLR